MFHNSISLCGEVRNTVLFLLANVQNNLLQAMKDDIQILPNLSTMVVNLHPEA